MNDEIDCIIGRLLFLLYVDSDRHFSRVIRSVCLSYRDAIRAKVANS
jgi:hypothetical protein